MPIYKQAEGMTECRTGLYVIIPVYNCKAYLRAAVQSVLDQPYKEIEIVLVDDGSTDGSSGLCDELEKDHDNITVVHQKNGGVSAARNTGIEYVFKLTSECEHEDHSYIAFLDSDDFWHPHAISFDPTECRQDIIAFSTLYTNSRANRFVINYRYQADEILLPERGSLRWISGGHFASHLFRTEFIKRFSLRFIDGCKYSEDRIFIRQVYFCASCIKLLPDFLYIYRSNSKSIMHDYDSVFREALLVPAYWMRARDWCLAYSEFSEAQKEAWKESITAYAGARVLEAICLMLEYGCAYDDIMREVHERQLEDCFARLESKELADWQKPDLDLYRRDLNGFIKKHKKSVWRLRLRQILINLPFFSAVYDRKRYPLDKDKMEGLS